MHIINNGWPTHIGGGTIDLTISSQSLVADKYEVLPTIGSDHFPIETTFNIFVKKHGRAIL